MKDIMLKITGRDPSDKGNDVEFITEGTLDTVGSETFIRYEESALSGMEGCTTVLTIDGGKVKLSRSGDPLAIDTVMEFEKGKRFYGYYDTPYGPLSMELLTSKVDVRSDGPGKGRLSIDYEISLKGLMETRKVLDIEYHEA